MNKSIMMGRVVNEPDLRYTQTENGELAIANFRLAVNRKFVRRGDPEADSVMKIPDKLQFQYRNKENMQADFW